MLCVCCRREHSKCYGVCAYCLPYQQHEPETCGGCAYQAWIASHYYHYWHERNVQTHTSTPERIPSTENQYEWEVEYLLQQL